MVETGVSLQGFLKWSRADQGGLSWTVVWVVVHGALKSIAMAQT